MQEKMLRAKYNRQLILKEVKGQPHGADKLAVKICEAEVFNGLLLLLWRYYAQKPIVFALSPLALGTSLRQPSPHTPPQAA